LTATGVPGHPGDGFDDRRLDALDDAPVVGRAGMDPVSQVLALVHGDAFEGKRDQPPHRRREARRATSRSR